MSTKEFLDSLEEDSLQTPQAELLTVSEGSVIEETENALEEGEIELEEGEIIEEASESEKIIPLKGVSYREYHRSFKREFIQTTDLSPALREVEDFAEIAQEHMRNKEHYWAAEAFISAVVILRCCNQPYKTMMKKAIAQLEQAHQVEMGAKLLETKAKQFKDAFLLRDTAELFLKVKKLIDASNCFVLAAEWSTDTQFKKECLKEAEHFYRLRAKTDRRFYERAQYIGSKIKELETGSRKRTREECESYPLKETNNKSCFFLRKNESRKNESPHDERQSKRHRSLTMTA